MRDPDGPFVGWGRDRKAKLVEKCGDIQQRATEFSFSTMLRYDEYLEHYKNAERPRKIQLDTMYGLCFRYCAIQIADLLKKTFKDKKLTLTFICEDGAKNFGQAKKIFDELKREEPFKDVFGPISTGGKKEHAGLQGADYVSHTAFLAEQDEVVKLTEFPAGADDRLHVRIFERQATLTVFKIGHYRGKRIDGLVPPFLNRKIHRRVQPCDLLFDGSERNRSRTCLAQ
jgi:hypothetical protein